MTEGTEPSTILTEVSLPVLALVTGQRYVLTYSKIPI